MKKISLISSLLILVLALGACGSKKNNSSESQSKNSFQVNALTASVEAAQKAKSYEFEATSTVSGKVAGQEINGVIKMNGITSADGKSSKNVIDLSSLLGELTSLLGPGGNFTMEQRVVDGISYTQNPDLFGTGKQYWVKTDLSSFLESQQSQNPNQYLQYLNATGSDVKKVGSETVNGQETTHYSSTITAENIRKRFDSKEWKKFYKDLGVDDEKYAKIRAAYEDGLSDIPVDVWIGKDDRPVKMKLKTTLNAAAFSGGLTQGSDSKVSSEFEILFSNWGVDVKVEVPPADQIVTQQQYEQQLQQDALSKLQTQS